MAGATGTSAYRLEVRDGDDSYGERCELGQANPTRPGYPLFREGENRWIGFKVLLPASYPVDARSWNVFHQLKQVGALGTPAVSMEVREGSFRLMNSDTNGDSQRTSELWRGPAARNRWIVFLMHVVFSPDRRRGSLELFGDLDGRGVRPLMLRIATHTMKVGPNGTAVQSHSRIGIYRDPAINGTSQIYFDAYTVATTAAEALMPTRQHVDLLDARRSAHGLTVRGRIVPRRSGSRRRVVVQLRRGGRWTIVGSGRAGRAGAFRMRLRVPAPAPRRLRLRALASGAAASEPIAVRRR
jgi:Polysaccharide lyase